MRVLYCRMAVRHSLGESRKHMPAGSLGPSALHDLRSTSCSEGRPLSPGIARTPAEREGETPTAAESGTQVSPGDTGALSAALNTAGRSRAVSPLKTRPAGSPVAPHLPGPQRCAPHQLLQRSLPTRFGHNQRHCVHPKPRHCRPGGQAFC